MDKILPYEINALNSVTTRARISESSDKAFIQGLLNESSINYIDVDSLVTRIFERCSISMNFHPDRLANNGKMIIENLCEQGKYYSQFVTGTTNGGKTAYPGGERDLWEKELFADSYHSIEVNNNHRPKYGSLNIMNYIDGASPRFGSCFFKLNKNSVDRCTFTFGDSYTNPEYVGTRDAFYSVLKAMFNNVLETKMLFQSKGFDVAKMVEFFTASNNKGINNFGRALDDYIEAQIHGEIDLYEDIDCFFVDESFRDTEIYEYIHSISRTFNIELHWIPARKVLADNIPDEFRGPMIKPVAKRILSEFQVNSGFVDAALIGKASQYTVANPNVWSDLGNEKEMFQYLKQLWHVLVQYG